MLTGTIINTLVILAGSAVGLGIHALAGRFSSVLGEKGARLGERLQALMMQGIALCVLYIGISGSLKGQNALAAILSMALGAILGELLEQDGPRPERRRGLRGGGLRHRLPPLLRGRHVHRGGPGERPHREL